MRAVLGPPKTTLSALLASRAGANQRLRRSFELTNTFVSADPDIHNTFVTKASALIQDQRSPKARVAFAELCRVIVDDYFHAAGPSSATIPFDDVIQVVVFKAILCSLFGADLDALENDSVLFSARAINVLWQLSKDPKSSPPVEMLPTLNNNLRRWLPTYENPLDYIIPTYETMWRVIAVTVALIHVHPSPRSTSAADGGSNTLRDSFVAFLDNPTRGQFQHWAEHSDDNRVQPSVEAVIQESIRLRPPTKRISRTIPAPLSRTTSQVCDSESDAITVVADIAALHYDPAIWNPITTSTPSSSPLEFDPSRFHPSRLTDLQKQCMLGFGFGRLKCVARDWAPLTAAVIVAAVVARVGSEHDLQHSEGEEKGRGQWAIVNGGRGVGGRDGWDGWVFERV
ncbi:cytochrome P450 [Cristinia sonorae]|uniref:Cytochrome P450 n=1 Tax=Cristinia sonorae TaxID=1940300 RepID=A0A8K0XPP8_9AGAR|nr:cytochrome P450 [Cristinia sonorae]